MSTEEEYIQQRRLKLQKLRDLGIDVYPRRFEFSNSITTIVKELQDISAEELETKHRREKVSGRIVSLRGHGKVGFLHLQQDGARLQVYIRKDLLGDQFAIFDCLDLGDFIGVEGELFRTKTGELTVKAEKLEFLAQVSGTGREVVGRG